MSYAREDVARIISERLDGRPARWAPRHPQIVDYDGRERTVDVFNAAAKEQRSLLRRLREVRRALEAAAGGPLIILFHTPNESRRLYWDFLLSTRLEDSIVLQGRAQRDYEILVREIAATWPGAVSRESAGESMALREQSRAGRQPASFWLFADAEAASAPESHLDRIALVLVQRDRVTTHVRKLSAEAGVLLNRALETLQSERFAELSFPQQFRDAS